MPVNNYPDITGKNRILPSCQDIVGLRLGFASIGGTLEKCTNNACSVQEKVFRTVVQQVIAVEVCEL